MPDLKAAVVGATGFAGSELVRLLARHPQVVISAITSESRAGELFSDVHPQFKGIADIELITADQLSAVDSDVLFLALPHGVSMKYVEQFKDMGAKIVDLSGDFRLSTPALYEEWYGMPHTYPKAIETAVYGLPELHAEKIKTADLVANPGCYPTSAILGLAPLMEHHSIEPDHIIVDAKSGVTGAGVKAKPGTHFSAVNDNFKAYGLKRHRHTIEIQSLLGGLSGTDPTILFTPHLLPVDRGILSTIYARVKSDLSEDKLTDLYHSFYQNAPFVRIRSSAPSIKEVRGTNFCDIFPTYDERTQTVLIISVIDNLVKGAAGQAIQNMNLMFGLDERTGLQQVPLAP
jgi:N-acetyl-gamma-glutamyl-phosphate reductase